MANCILLIDDAYPINSRNTRILASVKEAFPGCDIHILVWDREHRYAMTDEPWTFHLFNKQAIYGNKWQKMMGLYGFRKFCCQEISKINPDIIIASHWNNLLMLPHLSANQKLIYENLDAPTGPWIIRQFLRGIERYYMRQAVLTIHASRFYTDLYPAKYPQLVVENKPTLQAQTLPYHIGDTLRIAFLGNIRYLDILKNLVDAVRGNQKLDLSFHGSGPDLEALRHYIAEEPNIHCTGAYQYADMARLYAETDIIWAAYPNKDFNVKYAISNKFHESLAYAIPAIYANNTKLGEYVSSERIGLEVNPYAVGDIKELFCQLTMHPEMIMELRNVLLGKQNQLSDWQQEIKPLLQFIANS